MDVLVAVGGGIRWRLEGAQVRVVAITERIHVALLLLCCCVSRDDPAAAFFAF